MKDIVIAILTSTAFTALVNATIECIKNRSGAKGKANKAINFCLLFAIQNYGKELLAKPTIYAEEYKQFDEMYRTYKSLGGNGFVDRLKAEIDDRMF